MRELAKAVDLYIEAAEGNIHLIVHFVNTVHILYILFYFCMVYMLYIYRYCSATLLFSAPLDHLLICDIQH